MSTESEGRGHPFPHLISEPIRTFIHTEAVSNSLSVLHDIPE